MKLHSLFFTIVFCCCAQAQTISVAITDWPPFYSKNFKDGGTQFSLISKVFNKMGADIEPIWYRTGAGALVKLRAGLINTAAGWECTSERAQFALFSDPIGVENTVVFHHRDLDLDWSAIKTANQAMVIGITARYAYGEGLENLLKIKNTQVEVAGSDRHNLDLLFNRKIDLFIVDKSVGIQLLAESAELRRKNIRFDPSPIRKNPIANRLLVSIKMPNAQSFLKKFNARLKTIREDKKLDELNPDNFSKCVDN